MIPTKLASRALAPTLAAAKAAVSKSPLLQTSATPSLATMTRTPDITPIFWSGEIPIAESSYTIDCSRYAMEGATEDESELVRQMHETFERVGLVVLKNTGMSSLKDMRKWADVLIQNGMTEYKGGANSRQAIDSDVNVFDTGAPKEAHLHYHTEMAYVSKSTTMLAFCCGAAKGGKGPMYVSDKMRASADLLETAFGQKLAEKGITYIRCLTDRDAYSADTSDGAGNDSGIYNHWQRSFGVDSVEEVERLAAERGLEFEWGDNRYLKTKYTVSAFEYHPGTDTNLIYSSVADDSVWFDTWPGVDKLPTFDDFDAATPAQRPLKMTFGDGSEMSRQEIKEFIDVYDRYGIPINWQLGDVAVVCNYRFAHGRPSYDLQEGEERELGVVLGEMFDRVGQVDGKFRGYEQAMVA